MKPGSKCLIIGRSDMIKLALYQRLKTDGFAHVTMTDASSWRGHPDYVFFTEWVGGILAHVKYPAELLADLARREMDVISNARKSGAKKLFFLGRSCIYPKDCPQPMREDYLLSGKLDASTEPSAIATILGIRMCQYYHRQYGTNCIVAVPTGVYGPNDDFELETAHVLPALIRRFHEAKVASSPSVTIWGTGSPYREWLYIDDLVDAIVFLMDNYESPEMINIGVGEDLSIKDLARLIAEMVGYKGDIVFDTTKPDGAPRKLLDNARLSGLGWKPKFTLRDGIARTYRWFCEREQGT